MAVSLLLLLLLLSLPTALLATAYTQQQQQPVSAIRRSPTAQLWKEGDPAEHLSIEGVVVGGGAELALSEGFWGRIEINGG